MSPLDIWIMIQSTERELALRPRRLAQRRYLDEAIAQSMPEHARQGLLRRAWHAITGGPRPARPRVDAISGGDKRDHAEAAAPPAAEAGFGLQC
jgi:hypothetical protein